jgi:hypothetical protein
MAAAMQVTPDAADIAACILLQRHFRGNRCRGKVTRSELGVRSLRTNAGEAGGHGLRLVQLLQLRRVASASPSTRSDQDIDVVGRVFGDLESAACNPQLEQPFFASMDEGQRRELHRHLQLAPLRQTEYLFHQGDLSNDTFYYVVSGTVGVALVEDEASGRHTIVKRLGAGATFGENALATDVPAALRTSTIVGVEDCMLGTITRSAYLPTYSLPISIPAARTRHNQAPPLLGGGVCSDASTCPGLAEQPSWVGGGAGGAGDHDDPSDVAGHV